MYSFEEQEYRDMMEAIALREGRIAEKEARNAHMENTQPLSFFCQKSSTEAILGAMRKDVMEHIWCVSEDPIKQIKYTRQLLKVYLQALEEKQITNNTL